MSESRFKVLSLVLRTCNFIKEGSGTGAFLLILQTF